MQLYHMTDNDYGTQSPETFIVLLATPVNLKNDRLSCEEIEGCGWRDKNFHG
jgi:hypothetical protein